MASINNVLFLSFNCSLTYLYGRLVRTFRQVAPVQYARYSGHTWGYIVGLITWKLGGRNAGGTGISQGGGVGLSGFQIGQSGKIPPYTARTLGVQKTKSSSTLYIAGRVGEGLKHRQLHGGKQSI